MLLAILAILAIVAAIAVAVSRARTRAAPPSSREPTRPMRAARPPDESTHAGRPTVPPGTHGALCLAALLALGALGCSGATGANTLAGVRTTAVVAWPSLHRGARDLGLCQDEAPSWVTGVAPASAAPAPSSSAPPAPSSPPAPSPPAAVPPTAATPAAAPSAEQDGR
ncbi:MAG: hypothetical protein U0324_29095 [Polyangiales bacterium]